MKLTTSSLPSLLLALWAFVPEAQAQANQIRVCQGYNGDGTCQVRTTARKHFSSHP